MRRRTLTALVVLIVATVFLCPVSEMFDRWDHTAKTGKDTESTLMLVAECAGAAIAVLQAASALRANLVATRRGPVARRPLARIVTAERSRCRFPESPPLAPLRI